jgi:hypothetical protein
LKDGARIEAQAEYTKLAQETEASASLRQRASAIAEYLKANSGSPPVGATAPALPPPAPTPANQGTKRP